MKRKKIIIPAAKKEKIKLFGLESPLSSGLNLRIELNSNREAVVDGCKGICEYTENIVSLNIGKGTVIFTGEGLGINSLGMSTAVVSGNIKNIEFCV